MSLPSQFKVKTNSDKEKRVLANRYQLEKRLGSGNFGTAWLVTDLKAQDNQQTLYVNLVSVCQYICVIKWSVCTLKGYIYAKLYLFSKDICNKTCLIFYFFFKANY